jgi:enhancing lycopene biosynthesis protein 2
MAKEKRVGVVLSGCGFLDGAEIQEAACTLLSLDRRGAKILAFAPDAPQMHVVDHQKGAPAVGAERNVLAESARIVRGQIADLSTARAADLDALVFPGGYGAAKNLSSYGVDGARMQVHPQVERLVREVHAARKPIGFICIAPVIGAKVLGGEGVKLTIGNDAATAKDLETLGAKHVACKVDEICVDERLKVASTPAYMLGPTIYPVSQGIDKLVSAVLEMA